jgi:hypothetical protein
LAQAGRAWGVFFLAVWEKQVKIQKLEKLFFRLFLVYSRVALV